MPRREVFTLQLSLPKSSSPQAPSPKRKHIHLHSQQSFMQLQLFMYSGTCHWGSQLCREGIRNANGPLLRSYLSSVATGRFWFYLGRVLHCAGVGTVGREEHAGRIVHVECTGVFTQRRDEPAFSSSLAILPFQPMHKYTNY